MYNQECSDFQAGSVIRSKGRYVALDETAVFGIACKHAFPWRFINVKGGERLVHKIMMKADVLDSSHSLEYSHDLTNLFSLMDVMDRCMYSVLLLLQDWLHGIYAD